MARISSYSLDTTVNDHDRLIGTDGGTLGPDGRIIAGTAGATKNFTIEALRDHINGGADGSSINELRYETEVRSGTGLGDQLELYKVYAFESPQMFRLPVPVNGGWFKVTQLHANGNVIFLPPENEDGTTDTNFRIMNTTQATFTLNDRTASFEMIYIGDPTAADAVGWAIVGAN